MWWTARRRQGSGSSSKCGSSGGPDRDDARGGGGGGRRGGDGGRAPPLPGLRVPATGEWALPRQGRADVGRWAAVHGGVGRRDLTGGRAAVLCRGGRAGARASGAAADRIRAAGREGRPGV